MNSNEAIKRLETTITKLRLVAAGSAGTLDPKIYGILGNTIGELKIILREMTSPSYDANNDPVIKAYLEQKKLWRDY